MNDKQLTNIESIIDNLLKGDIYTPIKINGIGEYSKTLTKLEALRLNLIKTEEEKNNQIKQNHTIIASVAHDMKTPLQIISGYAECLQDGMDDKDYTKLIGEKIEQLNNLVLSLVDSSQEEINNLKSKMHIVDTVEFFTPVCEKLNSFTDQKHDKLIISKIPKTKIRLESYNIGRVIQNLITNAVKYSNENSTIKINFSKLLHWFTIKVKDNGYGILKEDIPHIFDKFYKEDKSRSDNTSNGLGLYITKQIVEEHGGTISVKSKKGKGTTFLVKLPIVEDGFDRTFASLFDKLEKGQKLIISFFTGYILGFLYRLSKFFKTRNKATLVGAFISIALMPFIYIFDFISIAAYNKIILLAD